MPRNTATKRRAFDSRRGTLYPPSSRGPGARTPAGSATNTGSSFVRRAEVSARRSAEGSSECGDERARAVVADVKRNAGHLLTGREQSKRVNQSQLLSPLAETHSGLGSENPF